MFLCWYIGNYYFNYVFAFFMSLRLYTILHLVRPFIEMKNAMCDICILPFHYAPETFKM